MSTVTAKFRGPASVCLLLMLCGCASNFAFTSPDNVPFRDRSVSQDSGNVRVTAAIPDADETHELFGVSLYRKNVQPVWIEIENHGEETVYFLPASVDPDYYTALELSALGGSEKNELEARQSFWRLGLPNAIAAGATHSGFMFTTLDEGTKAFNVELLSDKDLWQFTFFIPVPGLVADHQSVDFASTYAPHEVTDYTDPQAFIDALQSLPCCTVNSRATNTGDPLNIVLIGEARRLYYAVIRAGWDETEPVNAASGLKTVRAFFSGGAYRYSPVSSLYLFGRKQDVALQRIRENIHERNHFRLWLAPMTYEGRPVWVGQISRDIGVRFARQTITTHKIDPDVDETREFLIENLAYNQVLEKFAYVGGVGAVSITAPAANLTGDPYYTDGNRVVLWIAPQPTALDEIEYLDWIDPQN